MHTISYYLFVLSLFLISYNYVFYPMFINLFSRLVKDRHVTRLSSEQILPKVTLIVAAYNEEKVIEKKIENTLKLNYPIDKIRIIIISDGSDDQTATIVEKYQDRGIVSMHIPERQGKSAALNRAVDNAEGEIILFSDANNDFNDIAVRELVKHFEDSQVGAVTGAKHIYVSEQREAAKGDGLYWKYEAFIKKSESHLGSITAAEGEILAVRKSMLNPIDPTKINDDAAITFDIVKSGFRVLYEENARSEEQASSDLLDDVNVKIRMTAGGFQTIALERKFLFPPKTWFAFSFISHKILRWLTPHMMIIVFFTNIVLLDQSFFKFTFFLQLIFYVISWYGWMIRGRGEMSNLIYIPMYFTVMNIALFRGFIRYLRGNQKVTWDKAER